jgi:hypothetical protein
MSPCCEPIQVCRCCGIRFSRERVQSQVNPHNCEPCVSWGQLECAPRPRVVHPTFKRKVTHER